VKLDDEVATLKRYAGFAILHFDNFELEQASYNSYCFKKYTNRKARRDLQSLTMTF
jgi:hypothetical protein